MRRLYFNNGLDDLVYMKRCLYKLIAGKKWSHTVATRMIMCGDRLLPCPFLLFYFFFLFKASINHTCDYLEALTKTQLFFDVTPHL